MLRLKCAEINETLLQLWWESLQYF